MVRAAGVVDHIARTLGTASDRTGGELANLVTAATCLLRSATLRTETRGAHARSDFPAPDERWHRRIVHVGEGSVGDGRPGEARR